MKPLRSILDHCGILHIAGDLLKKFNLNVQFRTEEYSTNFDCASVSPHAMEAAKNIRGINRPPAVFLHGVMPRSGTVYVGELLRLHPDIYEYPNDLWEFPFLNTTSDMLGVQKSFFRSYKQNLERMGENDFLPLFGASMIHYLYSFAPPGEKILIKIPHVKYLNYFYTIFPYEDIILQLRDGRDVINSTIATWPEKKFKRVCKQWSDSAGMILNFDKTYRGTQKRYMLVRFEDTVRNPQAFIRYFSEKFDLDPSVYPYDEIANIKVRGSSKIKSSGKVSWHGDHKPSGFNPVGRWAAWKDNKKKKCRRICGTALIQTGYCNDLKW